MTLNVLVACEYSGIVRDAFRKLGHNAYSNDILPAESNPMYHLQGDCLAAVSSFDWDIIIMHPPCTALAVSGNRWYGKGMPKHQERLDAIKWTQRLYAKACVHCLHVAMENPVGVLPFKASQYIQPWQFGHGETKKTGLWLYNLPHLKPTNVVEGREQRIWKMAPSPDRWKERSRTYTGIADAMAQQWSNYVEGAKQ